MRDGSKIHHVLGARRLQYQSGHHDSLRVSLGERIWRECLWQFAWTTFRMLFAAKARVRVISYHDIPKSSGFILASNHISHFDPPMITVFFPRRIDWIGCSDLFRGRILRAGFSRINVISIQRSGP